MYCHLPSAAAVGPAAMAGTEITLEAQAVVAATAAAVGAMAAVVGGPGGTSAILVESLHLILGT